MDSSDARMLSEGTLLSEFSSTDGDLGKCCRCEETTDVQQVDYWIAGLPEQSGLAPTKRLTSWVCTRCSQQQMKRSLFGHIRVAIVCVVCAAAVYWSSGRMGGPNFLKLPNNESGSTIVTSVRTHRSVTYSNKDFQFFVHLGGTILAFGLISGVAFYGFLAVLDALCCIRFAGARVAYDCSGWNQMDFPRFGTGKVPLRRQHRLLRHVVFGWLERMTR
jgi:hypothetical protein